jgi:hypothetical protein
MEKQAALHIIQALAQGIDPHTGEAFPAASPYQHPQTVRALFQAAQALADAGSSSPRASQSAPENAGKPWTDEDDQTLAVAFDAGKTLAELAERHGRSRVAIQARLIKLGKIEPPADGPRFRIDPATPANARQ